jgi:hypothetical protein
VKIGDITLSYLEQLQKFDAELKTAEEDLLNGNLEGYNQVLAYQSEGLFSALAQKKLSVARKGWSKLKAQIRKGYRHSIFKDSKEFTEGYPPPKYHKAYWPKSADSVSKLLDYYERASDGKRTRYLWYWEMMNLVDFADRFVKSFGIPTIFVKKKVVKMRISATGKKKTEKEVVPNTPTPFLNEYFDLSALRETSIELWQNLVRSSVRRRVRTPLEQVARFLKMKLSWVHWIVRMDKPMDDEITKDLIYICKNPDFSSEPLIDIPLTEEGQVVYIIVCPSCGRKNEMGKTACTYCGAGL